MLQRVGNIRCVRCDYETSAEDAFEKQDADMMIHLTEKHSDWMIDDGRSIVPARLPIPDTRMSREMVKAIAADIGAQTAAYIEVMYPEAVAAASSTFLLSLRNHVHNEIVSAVLEEKQETAEQWLKRRAEFRREWRAAYRKIRRHKPAEPPCDGSL